MLDTTPDATRTTRRRRHAVRVLTLAAALALAACSSPPAPQKPPQAKVETPARDLLAEVRAAGADGEDSLDVQPLRDPVIEDLRNSATRAETAGKFKDADKFLLEALQLTPDDPELLQWRAELALAQDDYEQASTLANTSYERGPKLGGLCRRNWATIRVAREMAGNAEAAAVAQAQGARCTVEPPVRM